MAPCKNDAAHNNIYVCSTVCGWCSYLAACSQRTLQLICLEMQTGLKFVFGRSILRFCSGDGKLRVQLFQILFMLETAHLCSLPAILGFFGLLNRQQEPRLQITGCIFNLT